MILAVGQNSTGTHRTAELRVQASLNRSHVVTVVTYCSVHGWASGVMQWLIGIQSNRSCVHCTFTSCVYDCVLVYWFFDGGAIQCCPMADRGLGNSHVPAHVPGFPWDGPWVGESIMGLGMGGKPKPGWEWEYRGLGWESPPPMEINGKRPFSLF